MHTLYFGSESESDSDDSGTAVKPEPDQYDFKFIAGQIRTVPDLLNGFEPRTDIYDKMILYFLTGIESQSCMQNWQVIKAQGPLDTESDIFVSRPDFTKYLNAQPDDLDMS